MSGNMSSASGLTRGDEAHLELVFHSDWHIGTGSGHRGSLDRTVQRDVTGLPYVPAKSLRGVWRDACENVALALDSETTSNSPDTQGVWMEWVRWLFGTAEGPASQAPEASKISIGSARYSDEVAERLNDPALAEYATVIRAGVSIDPQTGTALANNLRFIEFGRAGSVLSAKLKARSDIPAEGLALLVAGAKLVDHLGGKRRRGGGRCDLNLLGLPMSLDQALELIGGETHVEFPPVPEVEPTLTVAMPDLEQSPTGWSMIPVSIVAKGPVLSVDRVVGNVTRSLERIPGAMILGLIQSQTRQAIWPLVESGRLRIGDGVVTDRPDSQERLEFAAPRSWATSKDPGSIGEWRDLLSDESPGPVSRLPASATVALDGAVAEWTTPSYRLRVHNTIDDAKQRPTSDVGGIYAYQAFDAGTTWLSEVIVDRSVEQLVLGLLQDVRGPQRLGRSKNDEYGEVVVTVGAPSPVGSTRVGDETTVVDLILTSDAILLDETLRPSPTPSALMKALREAGVSELLRLELWDSDQQDNGRAKTLASVRRRETWHVRWGLPRPTLLGLAAGSVLRVSVQGHDDRNLLAKLGSIGIGERTAEGFGRFVLLPAMTEVALSEKGVEAYSDDSIGVGESGGLWELSATTSTLEVAIQRQAILMATRTAAENAVNGLGSNGLVRRLSEVSSPSQLGALRSTLTSTDWQSQMRAWLEGVKGTKNRLNKWPKETLDDLARIVGDPASVFTLLDLTDRVSSIDPAIAKEAAALALVETIRVIQKGGQSPQENAAPHVTSERGTNG